MMAFYAESHRDHNKRAKPFTARDFLPRADDAPHNGGEPLPINVQKPAEMASMLRDFGEAMKARRASGK